MKDLSSVKAFLFDLDGTVYLSGVLIDGAISTLNAIREKNKKIVFLTNNSSLSDEEYITRLKGLGIFRDGDIFYSSLDATSVFINENFVGKKVYALATDSVLSQLKISGVNIVNGKNTELSDILLITFDKQLTYEKIQTADYLLRKGATYIVSHPDNVCPVKDGTIPDVGSFIQLFLTSSNRTPDYIIGKPNPFMAKALMKKLNLRENEMAMVGDRLYTDIAFGVNAGLNTVLVLSGETTAKLYEKSQIKADFVLDNLNGLKQLI